ncbi:MAG: hypothetical protein CME64_06430 [Halobacteriovoraceae bacterium]|nr:hypothetical protein [Halobacteriovoraceae bacterium]|tara:strand:- start:64411 stop:64827 length:417 start_codon:yes stop_codon:yes gene_type:complete
MLFGGLSEEEVFKIEKILEEQGISYQTGVDQQMLDRNQQNLSSFARVHTRVGDPISNHILSIEIQEEDFVSMNEDTKEKLLVFGITNEYPSDKDFASPQEMIAPKPVSFESGSIWLRILGIFAGAILFSYLVLKFGKL